MSDERTCQTDTSCGCTILAWADAPCTRPATQEDLLCDECRGGLRPGVVHYDLDGHRNGEGLVIGGLRATGAVGVVWQE